MQLAGRPVETDLSPASWVAEALTGAPPGTVASLVPPLFASYARVFHPAVRYRGDDDVDVTWAEVAAANRTTAHPLMQWTSLTGSMDFLGEDNQSPLWDDCPALGHLPELVAATMAAVLRRHTTTPDDCFFGLSGSGAAGSDAPSSGDDGDDRAAQLVVPGRGFHLVRGPVELAAANLLPEPYSQSANAWWPADRAWFVATDVDLVTTYVGGSAALVDELLTTSELECAPASPGQRTAWDADTVNPLPFDGPEPA